MDAERTSPTQDTAGRRLDATVIAFPTPLHTRADERLDEAVRIHGGELNGWFRGRTRNADLAEDLGQEVWLRIARQPLGRIGDLRAYLFRTARTVLADFGRGQGRGRDQDELDEDIQDEAPDAERRLLDVEALDRLQAAVDDLPLVQRRALIWARQEGLTLREIGKRLGVSESMACRYLADALKSCQAAVTVSDERTNLKVLGSD